MNNIASILYAFRVIVALNNVYFTVVVVNFVFQKGGGGIQVLMKRRKTVFTSLRTHAGRLCLGRPGHFDFRLAGSARRGVEPQGL